MTIVQKGQLVIMYHSCKFGVLYLRCLFGVVGFGQTYSRILFGVVGCGQTVWRGRFWADLQTDF
jgi:hypothetical protein